MEQLKDAAESLHVAGSWDTSAVVTPVIREPDEYLKRGLTQLETGESWLLEPQMIDKNPCLWRPGIRIGVMPGSWYHKNECFGPVLGLMRVDSIEEAIKIQNSSDFGLTGGLHSLDPKEIELWRDQVEVGNAYINRSTTGAIVQRQPFGGWKDSCVGPGPKAGGPNYVAAFCRWKQTDLPKKQADLSPAVSKILEALSDMAVQSQSMDQINAAAQSYAYWWKHEFSVEHDPSQIRGETNHFRYRPRQFHLFRVNTADDFAVEAFALALIACQTVGQKLEVSGGESLSFILEFLEKTQSSLFKFQVESETEFVGRLRDYRRQSSLRIVGNYDPHSFAPAKTGNIPIIPSQPLLNGRIELLNYLREQSMTEIVHRYGNIV